jgi:hypothetical protein
MRGPAPLAALIQINVNSPGASGLGGRRRGLQRRAGKSDEFLAQSWRAVEIKQALAGVVGGLRGFRQGGPLTAGDDSLKACARSLNIWRIGSHLF